MSCKILENSTSAGHFSLRTIEPHEQLKIGRIYQISRFVPDSPGCRDFLPANNLESSPQLFVDPRVSHKRYTEIVLVRILMTRIIVYGYYRKILTAVRWIARRPASEIAERSRQRIFCCEREKNLSSRLFASPCSPSTGTIVAYDNPFLSRLSFLHYVNRAKLNIQDCQVVHVSSKVAKNSYSNSEDTRESSSDAHQYSGIRKSRINKLCKLSKRNTSLRCSWRWFQLISLLYNIPLFDHYISIIPNVH